MEKDKIAYALYVEYRKKIGEHILSSFQTFILNKPAHKQYYDIVDKTIRKQKLEKICSK